MATLQKFTNEKLEKLSTINKILAISAAIWFLVMIIDGLLSGNFIEQGRFLRGVINWLFPITLYLIVLVTFISSYKILENRNYKPFLLFGIIQIIGFLIYANLKFPVPTFLTENKLLGIFIVAGAFVILFAIMFQIIKEKSNEDLINEVKGLSLEKSLEKLQQITYSKSSSNLGDIVSAIFSMLIITLVNIRTINTDLQYIISFGSLIGLLLIGYISRKDQTILAMLSLLDPNEAKYLYLLNTIKNMAEFEASRTKNEAEGYKMERDITGKQIELERDKYRASLEKLVKELERKKNQVMYEVIKTDLNDKLSRFEQMSPREKFLFLSDFENDLKKLQDNNLSGIDKPAIDYESLPLNEKIATLIGLTDGEIQEAIDTDMINAEQKFIWTFQNQPKIKSAILEFENQNEYEGFGNIYVAKSLTKYFPANHTVVQKMMDTINQSAAKLQFIKGMEQLDLMEFRIETPVKEYSIITRLGPKKEYLIHTILPTS